MSYEKKENGNSGGYSNLGTRGKNFQKLMLSEKKKRSDLGLHIFLQNSWCPLKKCNRKNHFASVCKTKAKLSVKLLDAVFNATEHSEIGKLFSLTHVISTVSSKGKH